MKVKELMSTKLITVSPEDKLDRVFFLYNFENIRHLPVVEKNKLVGILSDRDLKKILGPKKSIIEKPDGTTVQLSTRKVKNIMRRGVLTIEPEQRAADAAAIMAKRKIGALPVVHKEKLVGIITATDILKAFVKLRNDLDKFGK
ncbi:MAG: CBS domain-containing protein [Nitrospina sp.]|jgi:acetoin utilization protein AcuB|nr:CBS domain-containing protein [Nitrospina sp.]MBT3414174.1 CBS domain-containing protein [Nitrospina sp.]MBT4105266.1 CBS domain-containing protein [Nitrospina sp.]MBT4388836.1 CBS domain-containing protein [Nitrospina sp.]MBT4619672.1 CBS domain-containing protein [Nitrospina sp.]